MGGVLSLASNFTFLRAEWPALHGEATRAEQAALADPRTACFYARRTLELAVAWLFQAEGGRGGKLQMPYKADLSAFLFEPSFKALVGPDRHARMDLIRRQGNNAVHSARPVAAKEALAVFHPFIGGAGSTGSNRSAGGLCVRKDAKREPDGVCESDRQPFDRAWSYVASALV